MTAVPSTSRSAPPWWLGVLVAIVVAVVLDVVIALITLAAGASDDFQPLKPGAYVFFTVVGVLVATAGWAAIRRTRRAASTLRWLVPTVLVISLVPDILVGADPSAMAGADWTGVIGLMVMHVAVAAVIVAMLIRTLPVTDRTASSAGATERAA